jgi:hypothetical protein
MLCQDSDMIEADAFEQFLEENEIGADIETILEKVNRNYSLTNFDQTICNDNNYDTIRILYQQYSH